MPKKDSPQRLKAALDRIKKTFKEKVEIAVILGTGLGKLAEEIKKGKVIPYDDIPYFPSSTAIGHEGNLVCGEISGRKVIAMQGRFHLYEGYSLEEIIMPVRVARVMGAKILIISNAAGGLNPQFPLGSLVVITDHINFMGVNPLIGPNDDKIGPRFPDMSQPYSRRLITILEKTALKEGIRLEKGVYIGVTGPNLETAAEYRFMRQIGADMVGMSTVPEVIAAVHAGFEILGISCVTDRCLPDALKPADIKEILRVANEAEPKLSFLIKKLLGKI